MSERTCETCRWWKRISAGEDANDGDYPRGICTRNPPVIFQGVGGIVSAFPDTDKGDSCGEWRYVFNDIPPAKPGTFWRGPSDEQVADDVLSSKPDVNIVREEYARSFNHDAEPAAKAEPAVWPDVILRDDDGNACVVRSVDYTYSNTQLTVDRDPSKDIGTTPVAYCIQCADDDPKVHSLSFGKAALSKIVTRHGGKVVPLYLGKP